MNEIDKDTHASERHYKSKEYRQARYELVYTTTAANGAQHDQAQ